ncbi:uncharacterized protein V1510DRAFT_444411 [Dipodascopsis tothii]|uniref:uncharacterized protein n=1 Tax=Dipodascopsis tothii TaxID=44089 RepID=UPI0034CF3502
MRPWRPVAARTPIYHLRRTLSFGVGFGPADLTTLLPPPIFFVILFLHTKTPADRCSSGIAFTQSIGRTYPARTQNHTRPGRCSCRDGAAGRKRPQNSGPQNTRTFRRPTARGHS